MYFFVVDNDLLEKYTPIWDNVSADMKKKLIPSLSTIKKFCKLKENLMMMKLQIFTINKSGM